MGIFMNRKVEIITKKGGIVKFLSEVSYFKQLKKNSLHNR